MFEHFIVAQDAVYSTVLAELRAGEKQSHWMWFIFPQLRALGRSQTAIRFGLADLAEAQAYAANPVLGARLLECTCLVLAIEHRTAYEIFGSPDDLKLRSSMTLFARTDPGERSFAAVLDRYYGGLSDPLTDDLLRR